MQLWSYRGKSILQCKTFKPYPKFINFMIYLGEATGCLPWPRLDQHVPLPMHPRDFQWTASLAIPALSNHHVLSTVRSWALEIPMSRYGMTPWTNVYKTWGIDVITLQYVDTKWYKTTWVVLKVLVIVGNLTFWINKNVMRCQPRKPSCPGWSRPPYDCSVPLPARGIQKRSFSGVKKKRCILSVEAFSSCHNFKIPYMPQLQAFLQLIAISKK